MSIKVGVLFILLLLFVLVLFLVLLMLWLHSGFLLYDLFVDRNCFNDLFCLSSCSTTGIFILCLCIGGLFLKRDRKFEFILYPDSESYNFDSALSSVISYFPTWAYCLHDSDIADDGSPKKEHIHFLGKLDDVRSPDVVCRDLHLPINSIANVKSWKAACRYLVHLDSPTKYQYSIDDVISSFPILSFFSLPDEEQARRILAFISSSGCSRVSDLTMWALDNGCYSGFRRGFSIWSQILRE